MSSRLRAALYAQAGAVFSLHPCLYAGDRPTVGRSRFATILPGDAAVSPSNGDHAGTQRADPPPPRNGPKHRGAGRSRSATGPPRQSRSTRQFFCAEILVLCQPCSDAFRATLMVLVADESDDNPLALCTTVCSMCSTVQPTDQLLADWAERLAEHRRPGDKVQWRDYVGVYLRDADDDQAQRPFEKPVRSKRMTRRSGRAGG